VPVSELGDAFIKNYRKLERDFCDVTCSAPPREHCNSYPAFQVCHQNVGAREAFRTYYTAENRSAAQRPRNTLLGVFPRNSCRGLTTCIPPIVRPRNIGCGWPLGVTILAIVKAVFGVGWNTERRTKAIALYIGAAAKWARIKFDVTHDPGSPCLPTQRPAKI